MSAAKPIASLDWYDVADPASPELDELARKFSLHELHIDDTRHPPQRAKVEEPEQYAFVVLKKLKSKDEVHFLDFDVFIGHDFLITVHDRCSPFIDQVKHLAEQNRVQRLDKLFHSIVDLIVDEYQPLL